MRVKHEGLRKGEHRPGERPVTHEEEHLVRGRSGVRVRVRGRVRVRVRVRGSRYTRGKSTWNMVADVGQPHR